MQKHKLKQFRRSRRKTRTRRRVVGEPARPRLTVFRSLNHIYAQLVDDMSGTTLASASSAESSLGLSKTGNADAAKKVGAALAERAKAKGVERVIFDRNGFPFHGRVKALADAAREGGLQF
ncbi:MAG: 50S ribosomal protein L18 [Phycisphaerales bacterium]